MRIILFALILLLNFSAVFAQGWEPEVREDVPLDSIRLSDPAILADEKHLPLYKDMVDNLNVEFIPGGAALNSMRVAQWILQKPNVVSYFGCIGDDDYGRILVNKAHEAGVNIQPQINKEYSTGTCAVLITGTKRSLVANLSAANQFKRTHFDNKENWDLVEKAEYFYIGGR